MTSTWFNKINDVTTSFDHGPRFQDGREYPPRFRELQRRLYPDLHPLPSVKPADHVFQSALQLIRNRNWKIESLDEAHRRIQAVAITPLLRFRDDVVLVVESAAAGCMIQMRSRSRLGRSDFGANYSRIQNFFQDLKKKLNE